MTLRIYGAPPYRVAVIHGGPGAAGEVAPVARVLAAERGVLEPMQTAGTVGGQVEELAAVLEQHANGPATLIGYSWGAWLGLLLSARHPAMVEKLILVSSGPFEERYAAEVQARRMSRLTAEEREEWEALLKALGDPAAGDSGRLIRRITELSARADQFDPLEELPEPDPLPFQSAVFRSVWAEAAAMRRAGALLEAASRLRCPVVAIHGDHDPHPAEGVRDSLAQVLPELRFILLRRCGHQPWSERYARGPFYAVLRAELGGHAPGDPEPVGAG